MDHFTAFESQSRYCRVYTDRMQENEFFQDVADIRVGILSILYIARKNHPQHGGASGLELCHHLSLDDLATLEEAIKSLLDERLIEIGTRKFQITADGVDVYLKLFPPDSSGPSNPDSPPQGPPFWRPPGSGPDNPSGVPRRQRPFSGGDAVALPLPTDQKSET